MVKEYKDWLFVKLTTVSPNYEYKIFGSDLVIYWNGFFEEAIPLHPGSWQIIGKGDALDSIQWAEIVEWDSRLVSDGLDSRLSEGYKDYGRIGFEAVFTVKKTATESGHSLLRSLKMEPGTTLVLKNKEK